MTLAFSGSSFKTMLIYILKNKNKKSLMCRGKFENIWKLQG